MSHALVIGGTGMLRDATLSLADRFEHVSVVARSRSNLDSLEREKPGILHGIAADYRSPEVLHDGIRSAVRSFGPMSLIVAWIHDETPTIPNLTIDSAGGAPLVFVHVLSSAMADPSNNNASMRDDIEQPGVEYREAILGFVREGHSSRWLTHSEISAGVLAAVDSARPRTVVGVVEPWSERP